MMRSMLIVLAAFALTACAGRSQGTSGMVAALSVDPAGLEPATATSADYRIGANDLLRVTVFQVEDLSFEEIRVDASGKLHLPLVGALPAAGQTPLELSRDIADGLAPYLQNPQVSVSVAEASSQKVTVDGAVTKPGVYLMRGRVTLLQAVAMAEGPARTADLTKIAVFRTIDDQRKVALFDLQAIRQGRMIDPVLLGDDIVVVDSSRLSAAYRDFLTVLPSLAVFASY